MSYFLVYYKSISFIWFFFPYHQIFLRIDDNNKQNFLIEITQYRLGKQLPVWSHKNYFEHIHSQKE